MLEKTPILVQSLTCLIGMSKFTNRHKLDENGVKSSCSRFQIHIESKQAGHSLTACTFVAKMFSKDQKIKLDFNAGHGLCEVDPRIPLPENQ